MRQSSTYRKVWTVVGLLAAAALAFRGVQEGLRGGSWMLLAVALMMVAAIVLRNRVFRD